MHTQRNQTPFGPVGTDQHGQLDVVLRHRREALRAGDEAILWKRAACEIATGHGLAAAIADAVGVFAPNANSYRRFQAACYAPIARSWGANNRSVAVRVPTGAPASGHLEHRVVGADANRYLAIAAVLAGMHGGIKEKLDPGKAVEGDGYAQAAADLPNDWPAALRAMKGSAFLEDAFGERFLEIFHAIKAAECRRFSA